MENYLTVDTADGLMDIFSAAQNTDEKLPVVIVIQEAFGVNAHIKDVCRRLAEEGYLAMAPEFFHRSDRHLTVNYSEKEKIFPLLKDLTNEQLVSDLRGTLNFIPNLPQADSNNIFTMGFCIGGFTSLLAALHFPLTGAISFYGAGVVQDRKGFGIKPFVQSLDQAKCPMLLFFGDKDVSIPESDRFAIRAELDSAHVPHEMLVFGDADHGFFCDQRKSYQPKAAKLAWNKSLEWMNSLTSSEINIPRKNIMTYGNFTDQDI